ncbi:hypothetical protein RFI_07686 [Reticulomyxa filosa]|uniref:ATPase AAA-type core domain-containing protein n=1 Tax=Reticulomyxa filosa TaxID=46433 RepID=X6NU36_RETFI|nr:hypothetical protein RFI_07686 [Reticulomyxa filosa]|eukprot:ETO29433.1 hypothetical protein RFI_07686 [Reticulomyxa filosa]
MEGDDRKRGGKQQRNVVFFDEINTSPDIGWFKELVCSHSLDGIELPEQIKIIGACNPYRRRAISPEAKEYSANDPLSRYIYQVYPLCETMKEYLWSFGQLSLWDEEQYIWEMSKKIFREMSTNDGRNIPFEWKCAIAGNVAQSQRFLRESLKDKDIISLRDAARFLKLFSLLFSYVQRPDKSSSSVHICRCMTIALSLCYYFRLDYTQRQKLDQVVSTLNNVPFSKNLEAEIDAVSGVFEMPKGVALNQVLKENLFVLFFCIVTATPIVLVGKPGASKTLSFEIMRSSFSSSGIVRMKEKLKEIHLDVPIKPIQTVAFQCTRDSKPSGIMERWGQAMIFLNHPTVNPLVLLDEIGLAEHSTHRPLKILHQLLETPKIAFVGISNWILDAAKMNRVIMHQIRDLSTKDLTETAQEMCRLHCLISKEANNFRQVICPNLQGEISNITTVYDKIIQDQSEAFQPNGKKHFFGARDFYALIRHQLHSESYHKSLEGFARNFGGIDTPEFRKKLEEIITQVLGMEPQKVVPI